MDSASAEGAIAARQCAEEGEMEMECSRRRKVVMSDLLVILGAIDPETEAIEKLCHECGVPTAYALAADGRRVHPGNMYEAAALVYADGQLYSPGQPYDTIVEVECMVQRRELLNAPLCLTVDHHRPGDVGYGRPPSDFMAASSIGQVISLLAQHELLPESWEYGQAVRRATPGEIVRGTVSFTDSQYQVIQSGMVLVVPQRLVLCAAADHCLGSAYRGECPGVDPDELMRWRAESRAAFQGRPVADVLADIEAAKARVLAAPMVVLGAHELPYGEGPDPYHPIGVRDMRTAEVTADARGAAVPELPEAALRLGQAYLAGPLATPDGRQKVVLGGATPEQVEAFLEWATPNGIVDLYGDPARGFAGGYVSHAR